MTTCLVPRDLIRTAATSPSIRQTCPATMTRARRKLACIKPLECSTKRSISLVLLVVFPSTSFVYFLLLPPVPSDSQSNRISTILCLTATEERPNRAKTTWHAHVSILSQGPISNLCYSGHQLSQTPRPCHHRLPLNLPARWPPHPRRR